MVITDRHVRLVEDRDGQKLLVRCEDAPPSIRRHSVYLRRLAAGPSSRMPLANVTVTITPAKATLFAGEMQTLGATVVGDRR
jgi:hypothetical protein